MSCQSIPHWGRSLKKAHGESYSAGSSTEVEEVHLAGFADIGHPTKHPAARMQFEPTVEKAEVQS